IAAGDLGRILEGRMLMMSSGFLPDARGQRPALVRQPFMENEARLLIAESLIHHLDAVRWLVGPLRVVSARTARTIDVVKGETQATVLLENFSGAPIVVSGNMTAHGFPARTQDRLELIGSRATATLDGTELRLLGSSPRHESYDHEVGYQA